MILYYSHVIHMLYCVTYVHLTRYGQHLLLEYINVLTCQENVVFSIISKTGYYRILHYCEKSTAPSTLESVLLCMWL